MISKTLEVVRSSRVQICRECGAKIPPLAESLKITIEKTGAIKYKKTFYSCRKCEG